MLPVVIVNALLQALLVVDDPTPEGAWGFALRVGASGLAMILALWLILGASAAAVDADARFSVPPMTVLIGATAAVVLGGLAGVVSPILPVVVAVAAVPLLASLASRPSPGVLRTVTCTPGRALLGFFWVALLFIVNWVIALLLGFFIGGPVSAALSWVVFGFSASILATHWAVLHRRAAQQVGHEGFRATRTAGSPRTRARSA
ncbi:hypothetical protein CEY15_12625 [Dietzia natronolimnaea]|uniref:Uncharacterized protein n=1 Tax=Dietzia natronolimnaea TaxID=161920 RepID=A0A2A2WMY5_9ACTN|nr:hypothetical protein [Dietzia natronolimnaea]PAY22550.1 hypothetical protein CEY15_12625 [Dietzia natronolimnaea]